MSSREIDKEMARVVLVNEAYANWYMRMDRALARFGGGRIDGVAADAQRCLEAALSGIEEWLDTVYERGMDPEEADFRFLEHSNAAVGMGHRAPSRVIGREMMRSGG